MATNEFKPALIIVDLQEDFCPPDGSLAVPNGRDIIPTVHKLLDLSFVLKVATKDWHPADHISFASNHTGKKPFTDFTTIINPSNPDESYESRLWPDHCIQKSPGAELISELDMSKIDKIVKKGERKEVEMYSAFYDPLEKPRIADSGLAGLLKEKRVSHVYVVGLAADYCVKATALDAAKEGFITRIVEEGTRAVDASEWNECKKELDGKGVRVVSVDDEEFEKINMLKTI